MAFQNSRFDSGRTQLFTENLPNIVGEQLTVTRVMELTDDPVTGSVKFTFWGELASRPGQILKVTSKGSIARKAKDMAKVGGDLYITAKYSGNMYAYLLEVPTTEPPTAAKK